MIDVSNLKDALKALGFVAYGDIYEKAFSEIGCSLKVDFQAKRLIYPNEIRGRERNDSFDQKENFVVFECVCRLLSKGYRPEHIELEKEWHLGHDAKGGRADICVSDTSGSMLFIIECKTWGREYDKALNDFNFNKALRTSVKKAFHISSKYPLVKLASVCDLNTSKTEIHDTPDDLLV